MVKIAQPANSMEVWEPGLYPGRVKAVEETTSTFPGSEGKPRLKWTFVLRNDEDETTEVPYWTNATLSDHPQATLRPLLRVLLPDVDLDAADAEVDTDECLNKRCRVVLGINDARGVNKVEKVLAADAKKAAKPAAKAEETEDEGPPF